MNAVNRAVARSMMMLFTGAVVVLGTGLGSARLLVSEEPSRLDAAAARIAGEGGGVAWGLMSAVTRLGDRAVTLSIALAVALALSYHGRRWAQGAFVLASVGGGYVLSTILKVAIARERPLAGSEEGSFAFPSGHAMVAVTLYGALAVVAAGLAKKAGARVAVWAGAAVVALLVGASRAYLGLHFASDVVAGWLTGCIWLGFCAAALAIWAPFAPPDAAPVPTRGSPPASS